MNEQDLSVINQDKWFKNRTQLFRDKLVKNAKLITLNAGDALFLRGDENTGLYCVINGVLRVSTGVEIQFMMPMVNQPFRFIMAYNPVVMKTNTVMQGRRFDLKEKRSNVRFTVGYSF